MELLSEAESKIAEWIWANPGIGSMKLVAVCESSYGWKQSTVFTMIRRMKDKGLLVNEKSHLTMSVSRYAYYHMYTKHILECHYGGSLTAFVESALVYDGIDKNEAGRLLNVIHKYTN